MKNIQSITAIAAIFIMSLVACSSSINKGKNKPEEVQQSQPQEVNKQQEEANKLPAFAITDVNGNVINMNDFKGKKVFVNLWATWCPPCRAEIPSIEKLYNKADKEKVVFVMLSLDDNFDKAKEFAKSNNLQLPVYYPAQNLPAMFNTDGIPATFIFNENGELIKQNTGMEDYDTDSYLQLLKS